MCVPDTNSPIGHDTGSRLGIAFSKKLPHACPECNGCVKLESMLCEGCGLDLLPRLTTPDVYALLYPALGSETWTHLLTMFSAARARNP
jgi:hypothetical protein